jgi:hypothetical protein
MRHTIGRLRRHSLAVAALLLAAMAAPVMAADEPPSIESQIAALKAENERLRTLLPSQSHAMIDVAYHFTNLWFAGRERNWPLAQFYFNESRNRIAWALRIVPARRISSGELVLQPIFDAFEKTQLAAVKRAIESKNVREFTSAYKAALDGCTGCHVAAEKPYLHLIPPKSPESRIVQFSP